jgi:hypothetical protein
MSTRRASLVASLAVVASLAACAPAVPPRFVRAADLGKLGPLAEGQPLVIEFQEGDVIPLRFSLDGPFVKSPDGAPPIPLRVVRRFFLRIDESGLKSSVDGKDFDGDVAVPGRFQMGVGATKNGTEAHISIRTPTPRALVP